jgi:glycine hydroxymethyltransferase
LRLISGGTDNHLMLVDVGALGHDPQGAEITGKAVEKALDQASLHCNKNLIPYDPKSALVTSGIRLGTPAATTRGLGADEFRQVGLWIAAIAREPQNSALQEQTRRAVHELVQHFPVPA